MKILNKKVSYLFLGLLSITQLCDIHAMDMFPQKTIQFQFSDQREGEFTEVSEDLAMQFATFSNMIEDLGDQDEVISLHNITESTWFNIQNLLLPSPVSMHIARPRVSLFGLSKFQGVKTPKGDLTGFKGEDLKNMILALNYLGPNSNQALFLFDKAKEEYTKRLIEKIKLEVNDFFNVPELDEPILRLLTQQIEQHIPPLKFSKVDIELRKAMTLSEYKRSHKAELAFHAKRNLLLLSLFEFPKFDDDVITIWDVSDINNPFILSIVDCGELQGLPKMIFDPTGDTFVLLEDESDMPIRRWDISNPRKPKELSSIKLEYETSVSAAFNHDGTKLALGMADRLSLWDMSNRENPVHIKEVNTDAEYGIIYGDNILVSINKNSVTLWNPNQLESIAVVTKRHPLWYFDNIHLSFDSKVLIVTAQKQGGMQSVMHIFDISNRNQPSLVRTIRDHRCIGFVSDSRQFISSDMKTFDFTSWNILDKQNLTDNDIVKIKEKYDFQLYSPYFLRKLIIILHNIIKDPS